MAPSNIHEYLDNSNWDGDLEPCSSLMLEGPEPTSGKLLEEIENHLTSLGLRGITGPDSAENYHVNIVGVEGWKVDLINLTYQRLDGFGTRWEKLKSKAGGSTPVASLRQLDHILDQRLGTLHAKRYNI